MTAAERLRVLLVDDDPRFATVVSIILEADGRIEIVGAAHDGRTGVDLAEALVPDVIVTDLNMPVMDGVEATRAIRESLPSVRVLMLTGSASADDVQRAVKAGVSGYVRKERIAELADAILAVASTEPVGEIAHMRYEPALGDCRR